ncbi:MAG: TIGR02391 family protein [Candidatus Dormibacteria bacterium]
MPLSLIPQPPLTPDWEAMTPDLLEFIQGIDAIESHRLSFKPDPNYNSSETNRRVEVLVPTIKYYSDLLEPEVDHDIRIGYSDNFTAREFAIRTLGLVQREINRARIHSSALHTSNFHPAIWSPEVRKLWHGHHHLLAIEEASLALQNHLQQKLQSEDKGIDLFAGAFSPTPKPAHPTLFLQAYVGNDKAVTNAHEGANGLGKACWQLLRNLSVHRNRKFDWQQGLESLAMMSAYARLVDEATRVASVSQS